MNNSTAQFYFDIESILQGNYEEDYSRYMSEHGIALATYKICSGIGIYLMHGKIMHYGTNSIEILSKNDYVHFVFVMESPRIYVLDHRQDYRIQVNNLMQMAFLIQKNSTLSFTCEVGAFTSLFELSMSLSVLRTLLPKDHFLIKKMDGNENFTNSRPLFNFPMPISPALKTLLYDMAYCRYEGVAKQLYFRGKILQLFALQEVCYEKSQLQMYRKEPLNAKEITKMMRARDILTMNTNISMSASALAREVGTNECYLKRNFKNLFGTTIAGYSRQLKMEKAKKLLYDKKNVREVAKIVGYKHANHFSTAFRKYFGYMPNSLQ